ncbi:MAG: mttB 1, partial [Chloroflexi bacterium]|nr:mttB 1 [Chloroflexota bacterium]
MVRLTVLQLEEIEAIHSATLRVLNETGITLTHTAGREILVEAGARIQGNRVLLPPDLVESMLARCPKLVSIGSRSGRTVVLGDGSLHWHNLGGAREVYEPHTGQRRPATIRDVMDSTRLLDSLSGATTITPFFTPQDVSGAIMSLAMYRYALPNTTKPIQGPG